ncbi:SDR family NAD(P)-dependent oxidoreductase [Vibrio chagasii]|nr:SDR family NAD(P)-dependent oxidoreductase [Vibrio chagasii]
MGATDGIGLETIKMLAQQGHHILIHGRSPAKISTCTPQLYLDCLRQQSLKSYIADLSATLSEVEALATQIMADRSDFDVLINAGVYKVSKSHNSR